MELEQIKKNFESNGYLVSIFSTNEEAVTYLRENIRGKTVGFGGSQTLTDLDLRHALANQNTLFVPDFTPEGENFGSTAAKAMTAEVYLLSANAVTENGEIINIDGTGNRLAGSLYGHQKVYYIISENKISKNLEAAIYRARNTAAPRNALRLRRNTPCAQMVIARLMKQFEEVHPGEEFSKLKWQTFIESLSDEEIDTHCYDCKSPQRICSSLLIHWKKPSSMDAEIILLKSNTGY
jgi:hypothetical protein